eukprot:913707-Rhodomonas_salina.2
MQAIKFNSADPPRTEMCLTSTVDHVREIFPTAANSDKTIPSFPNADCRGLRIATDTHSFRFRRCGSPRFALFVCVST